MDFRLTEEQQQFAGSLRRWLSDNYGFEQRKAILEAGGERADAVWQALTELGATALPIPASQGGLDGGPVDMLVVMQELGRGLMAEPYFATMLGAEFLVRSGGHPLLERVAAGQARLACAIQEKQARHDLFDVTTTASAGADGYVLNGRKSAVIHGAQADALIVVARTEGTQRDIDGLSLFLVPADTAGLKRIDYRTFDGLRAADIELNDVAVPRDALLGEAGQAWNLLEAVADYGVVLLCAEALGLMESTNEMTLEYLKTRQQFGVPIGTFQVLQHQMADMYMHFEQARSITTLAVATLDSSDPGERRQKVSAAKAQVGRAMQYIGQHTVQMHGGMGMTDEFDLGLFMKRARVAVELFGDVGFHADRLATLSGY